jgi:hypothetical protein
VYNSDALYEHNWPGTNTSNQLIGKKEVPCNLQIVRNYMSATGGLVTFFAPWNEAFEVGKKNFLKRSIGVIKFSEFPSPSSVGCSETAFGWSKSVHLFFAASKPPLLISQQILKLHIVPAKELVTEEASEGCRALNNLNSLQITNDTIVCAQLQPIKSLRCLCPRSPRWTTCAICTLCVANGQRTTSPTT